MIGVDDVLKIEVYRVSQSHSSRAAAAEQAAPQAASQHSLALIGDVKHVPRVVLYPGARYTSITCASAAAAHLLTLAA